MRTYFRDKQVHISAAVAHAILHYVIVSHDLDLLAKGGARTILECARFYWSLLLKPVTKQHYEIWDVIGPDEYHERVNNNVYTNRMALDTFQSAHKAIQLLKEKIPDAYEQLCKEANWDTLSQQLCDAEKKLYIPQPNADGIIEQFDGYFGLKDVELNVVRSFLKDSREYWGGAYGVASDTQIIKQADVVTMLEVFHSEYPVEILKANWNYYEPRTEHGSSLSACMYALLACRFGAADCAYPFFMKSATAEIKGGGKQWAGLVYIGGTHPAAAGGARTTLVQGFCGLDCTGSEPTLHPCLPSHWKSVVFRFYFHGMLYRAQITPNEAVILRENE